MFLSLDGWLCDHSPDICNRGVYFFFEKLQWLANGIDHRVKIQYFASLEVAYRPI